MNGTANQKRKMRLARVAAGMLAAGFLWFCGNGQAAPEIRWAKSYTPRVWTYATGTKVTVAYDYYKDGNVYVIGDGNTKQSMAMSQLSAQDQAWVLDELKKPHGLINDVVFIQWQDQQPQFRINASFFTRGNLTESPVVCIQYLLRDQQNRVVKRICEPVVLYPAAGKLNLEQMSTKVMRPCLGPREQDSGGVKRLAHRAVMLLLQANQKDWLVLDAFTKQDENKLREQGIPLDWWDPRYPAGAWPAQITGGGKQ